MKKYLIESKDEIERLKFQNSIEMYDMNSEMNYFSLKPGDVVLDAGCGSGNLIDYLIDKKVSKIDGIDLSEDRVNYAKEKFSSRPEVSIFQGYLDNTKLEKEKYSKIFLRYVFEHVTNPKEILNEMYSLLSEDGEIGIINFDNVFFNFYTKNEKFNVDLMKLKHSLPQDFEIAKKLPTYLALAGFTDVKWEASTFFINGELRSQEKINNEMRLVQASEHIAHLLGGQSAYQEFADNYLAEMDDPNNVMSYSKFLIKAKRPKQNKVLSFKK